MATNLDLDPGLVTQALKLGGHKTKREAVTAALEAYVQRIRQIRVLRHEGTIDIDARYDPKASRRAR